MDWLIRALGGLPRVDASEKAREVERAWQAIDAQKDALALREHTVAAAEAEHLDALRLAATPAYTPTGDVVYSTFRFEPLARPDVARLFVTPRGATGQGFQVLSGTETNFNEYDLPLSRIRAISVHLACALEHRPQVAAFLRRYAVLRLERGSQEVLTIRPLSDFDLNGTPIPWFPREDRRMGWVVQVCTQAPAGAGPQTRFDLRVAVYGDRAEVQE